MEVNQRKYSNNYILRPHWEETEEGGYQLALEHSEIPQLNHPRERSTVIIWRENLYVMYGRGINHNIGLNN